MRLPRPLALLLAVGLPLALAACDGADSLADAAPTADVQERVAVCHWDAAAAAYVRLDLARPGAEAHLANHPEDEQAGGDVLDDGCEPWPASGGRIAFTSLRDGNFDVYVMDADGSNVVRLTNDTAIDSQPTWSPDGTRIAFRSDRDGNAEVYVMASDGSGQTRPTNNTVLDAEPAWSPDGTRISFATIRDGNDQVYVMGADGTGQTNLSNNGDFDFGPAWGVAAP